MRYAHITGWGVAIPEKVLTNEDIAEIVDTNDEWITTRTGIKERRIAADNEAAFSSGEHPRFQPAGNTSLHEDCKAATKNSSAAPEGCRTGKFTGRRGRDSGGSGSPRNYSRQSADR